MKRTSHRYSCDFRYWHEAADFRAATIRPLSEVIRKLAERPSHRRL